MMEQKRRKILTAVAGISFIQGLQYCVAPVLEQIRQHFPDTAVSLVQMLITAPALLAMAVAVISGWLVVKVSKKKMLVVAGFLAGFWDLSRCWRMISGCCCSPVHCMGFRWGWRPR